MGRAAFEAADRKMINEQRDRQTDRKSQISRARGILFASPAPTGSQILRSSDTQPFLSSVTAVLPL